MMMMAHQQLVYSSKIINQIINMFLLILRLTNSLSSIAAYKIEIYLFHMSCSSWVYLSVLFIILLVGSHFKKFKEYIRGHISCNLALVKGKDVTEIFLTQAIVIGIFGGLVGMILGFIIAKIVNHIPFRIAGLATLPMAYHLKDYFMSFVFGLITTLIAGYLPARKASKVDPVTIIRV